jgi:hypothetical protein
MAAPTMGLRRAYYFISALLYPIALGVAVTWFVLLVYNLATDGPHIPGIWATLFALWFTVYHTLLFVRLIDRRQAWSGADLRVIVSDYDQWSLGSDILDTLAVFLAFGAIGFQADTDLTPLRIALIFVAAMIIPYSARVARETLRGLRAWLAISVAVLALCGIGLNFLEIAVWNSWILAGLWLLLAIYWFAMYSTEDVRALA